jgi:hypothetical protein
MLELEAVALVDERPDSVVLGDSGRFIIHVVDTPDIDTLHPIARHGLRLERAEALCQTSI